MEEKLSKQKDGGGGKGYREGAGGHAEQASQGRPP